MASLFDQPHKSVATWISMKDYEILQRLAQNSKVTVSLYIRAIIVDAVQEELTIAANAVICNTVSPTKSKVV